MTAGLGSAMRDFADFRFLGFADAASVRRRGTYIVAARRASPFRSFESVVVTGTDCVEKVVGFAGGERVTTLIFLDVRCWSSFLACNGHHRLEFG